MKRNLVSDLMSREPDRWLDILEQEYKINIVRDGDLVSLKYNQIESPMSEPIVQQCRGMVVDTATRTVLAWPYNKFWNHGDAPAATIDWATARVQEKLDGSLMILYWHAGEWRVASSGTPTAGGSFGADTRTFREAFWQVWAEESMGRPPSRFEGWTFMFELCAHENRVVVRHEKPRIVLHGARDEHGFEVDISTLDVLCAMRNWERVDEFPIDTVDACLAAAEALDPIAQEGFVVVDAEFNRVKIKSPRYVILHHMKGEATPRRAIELWQTGETGELLLHFPEMGGVITPVQEKLDEIAAQAAKDFLENYPRPTRKEFALAIKDRPWSAVLFRMLDNPDAVSADAAKAIMRAASLASLERMVTS